MSFIINFEQLTDLAVNPLLGTVNTTLLHNLLYVIIDQLQLSSNFVELNKETAGNVIGNSHQGCALKVREFDVLEEVDETSGEHIKVREEKTKLAASQPFKLFNFHVVEPSDECRSDCPSITIKVIPNVKPQVENRSSATAFKSKAVNDAVIKLESSRNALKPTFDIINATRRIEALEIGTRQLADIMKQFKCDCDNINIVQKEQKREIDFLQRSIENLTTDLRELKESKSDVGTNDDGIMNMIKDLESTVNTFSSENKRNLEAVAVMNIQIEELTLSLDEKLAAIEANQKKIEEPLCIRLNSLQEDLVKAVTEIQEMLDAKLDKGSVDMLKKFIQDSISNLKEKIEKVDCPKSLAAGTTIKIYKDLNCVSCGDNVIQGDTFSLMKLKPTPNQENNVNFKKDALTRNCGGVHTITLPY